MNAVKMALGAVFFFVLIVVLSSVFTVTQGEHALLLRLGKLVENSKNGEARILGPGLHVKTPFIESVRIFDTRLQTLDIKSSPIVTKEKKDVIVDYFVKWRIVNIPRYFQATGGNELTAETLLEQQLNTSIRAEFGKRQIVDLVSDERDEVMDIMINKAQQQAGKLGVTVVDVRIKGIELPPSTSNSVYQLMRAEMQKIANRHRADGHAIAEAIKAGADAEVTVLLATARSKGQEIRAGGEAEAAGIYAKAFDKNKVFFDFYRSLKAYEASFNKKSDLLVLDQSSSFFDYFKHPLLKGNGAVKKN
ncbi:protease modulator HflC [Legionella spiritensis]|uniref:Protein HflC n=1 Tax=Legionella spiritensis TaxID=452 RepID=A0A0W0Z9V3_LEGSP|nr:protease modulator HflC [Legionella spiritensis]KTD65892.1 HflC protein [Legionella spiritensis]SNV32003.1 HflC protein [Legionella spiritensis]VEG92205.1 HflC protein [Legionella spiritensis]